MSNINKENSSQQLLFDIPVIPNKVFTSFLNSCTSLANPPQGLWDGSGIIQVNLREILLDCICCNLGFVVWNGGIKVMGYMS